MKIIRIKIKNKNKIIKISLLKKNSVFLLNNIFFVPINHFVYIIKVFNIISLILSVLIASLVDKVFNN